jgi:hypothetical protein
MNIEFFGFGVLLIIIGIFSIGVPKIGFVFINSNWSNNDCF